jgi:acetyltransferase-like isoleucine patch superfamily enzyme
MGRRTANPQLQEALKRLDEFLRGDSTEMLFRHPAGHPSSPTGFCFCDRSAWHTFLVYLRGALLSAVMNTPFNGLKVRLLRSLGANVGERVYISHGTWIDPTYPHLIRIEDDVFLAMGVRIFTHEFRRNEFRAGRVVIRRGAFIGAYAIIACGVEIGENATVAASTPLPCDVPAGCTAIGNPPRIVHPPASEASDA